MRNKSVKPSTKRVCHFGTFSTEQQYSHNALVAESLTKAGWEVIDCRPAQKEASSANRVKSFSGPLAFLGTVFSIVKHRTLPRYDMMIVGYPSHADMFLAYVLSTWRRCPLVMDSFYGLYNTVVEDRKLIAAKNPLSKLIFLWEYCVLHMADYVLIDTETQAEMLKERYSLGAEVVFSVPVGIDESLWTQSPLPEEDTVFRVVMWATFIPLHGMNTVVEAAKILEDTKDTIQIEVWGDGQTADDFADLKEVLSPANLNWNRGIFPMEEIIAAVHESHCCIGILGSSDKAMRVVPYKVTQALATGRPVVTVASPETETILEHEKEALLIPAEDPQALADALISLAKNRQLCESMGAHGRLAYEAHLSNAAMQQCLATMCDRVMKKT